MDAAAVVADRPDRGRSSATAIRKSLASMYGHYDQTVDRESAYEKVKARTLSKESPAAGSGTGPSDAAAEVPARSPTGFRDVVSNILFGTTGPRGGHHDGLVDAAAKSAARSFGSAVSRAILRGALGSILGGSGRGKPLSRSRLLLLFVRIPERQVAIFAGFIESLRLRRTAPQRSWRQSLSTQSLSASTDPSRPAGKNRQGFSPPARPSGPARARFPDSWTCPSHRRRDGRGPSEGCPLPTSRSACFLTSAHSASFLGAFLGAVWTFRRADRS